MMGEEISASAEPPRNDGAGMRRNALRLLAPPLFWRQGFGHITLRTGEVGGEQQNRLGIG